MADFRQIYTRIWKDEWFSELPLDARLFFIYLFSNERAEVCGVYELPIKYMSFETNIPLERISELLCEFEKINKVYYRNGWVWVVNLRKYNETGSGKVATRITKDLALLPEGELKKMYCEYYGIPYQYGIDRVSIPVKNNNMGIDTPISAADTPISNISDTDTDTDTDTDDSAPSGFSKLSAFVANLCHVPEYNGGAKNWNNGLKLLSDIGATEQDIQHGYLALKSNKLKKYTVLGPQSLVTATANAMQEKDGNNGNGNQPKGHARGMEGLV